MVQVDEIMAEVLEELLEKRRWRTIISSKLAKSMIREGPLMWLIHHPIMMMSWMIVWWVVRVFYDLETDVPNIVNQKEVITKIGAGISAVKIK